MGLSFNADEVLQMAERIERTGARFYRQAAETCVGADDALKGKLLELAEMEDTHERTFTEMRGTLSGGEARPTAFDPEGETAQYLAAMADANVFGRDADPTAVACGKPVEEILRLAIALEKESIVFYLGLRDLVPERSGRSKVERILKEEMAHVALLRGHLAALT